MLISEMQRFEDNHLHKGKRRKLVGQLMDKGLTDKQVLNALAHVPRHWFFHPDFQHLAYEDNAYPIDAGQTISQPFTVAMQSVLLGLEPGKRVLEIGTGSGYQTAVLCSMKLQVFSIEVLPNLFELPVPIFEQMGFSPKLFLRDGSLGLSEEAPFAGIIVTAAAPSPPPNLLSQLEIGGKLVIPVGDKEHQEMSVYTRKTLDDFEVSSAGTFRFVPLVGKQGWTDLT